MFFYMPTKLFCETDCISNHANDLIRFGKKAYIVTGKNSSKKNGSLDDVIKALGSIGTDYLLFDKIEENPSVELIMEATAFAKDYKPDYVIGIGGGSPLDASKAIALMLANPERDKDLLFDINSPYNKALDVIAVPTTCGTGSEVTPYSILTLHDKCTKSSIPHLIFPEIALCDPSYLKACSDSILKNTAVDALGHFIESYINVKSTFLSGMLCEKGLSMWQEVKNILGKDNKSDKDYETLLMVSSIAGMAISHTGTSLPHGMSYSLTYDYGIPHGKAVGTFLPSFVEFASDEYKNKVLALLGYTNTSEFSDDLSNIIGTVDVPADKYKAYALDMAGNERKLKSCPYTVTKETIDNIYDNSLINIL